MVTTSLPPEAHWLQLDGPTGRTVELAVGHEYDALGTALDAGAFAVPGHYQLLFELIKPNSVVLDLGAHIGTFSLAAASTGARVVAFEPAPRNVALLEASLAANEFERATLIPAAAAEREGVVRFLAEGAFGRVVHGAGPGYIEVRTVVVAEVLENLGIEHVDVVKIDIEGSELAALDGMARLLRDNRGPALVIEGNAHTLHQFGRSPADLLERLDELGYATFLIEDRQLIPVTPASVQPRCVVDYLALKPDVPPPDGWRVRSPLSYEELAAELLAETRTWDPHKQTHVGRVLASADPSLAKELDARTAGALLSLNAALQAPEHSIRPSSTDAVFVRQASLPSPSRRRLLDALRAEVNELSVHARALSFAAEEIPRGVRQNTR